jgi:hypothetical protein
MRRAFLIVGFNNWGKTTLIYDLFVNRRFQFGRGYPLRRGLGKQFTVESHSNDDTGEERFIALIERRVMNAPLDAPDLIGALCPTREERNSACSIIKSKAFAKFDEIHMLLLRYKWDLHAELCIGQIESDFKKCGDTRLIVHVIDEGTSGDSKKRAAARCMQAHKVISDALSGDQG